MKGFDEYPAFIPVGDHHIATIVTVPDGDPRGVVVLTTGGGGALRSQRFRLWTRAARGLAVRGIASVRMEYPGVGDSTGTHRIGLGWKKIPVEDLIAVARFATSVTGTEVLGLSGNCAGARASIRAVGSLPGCRSLVLFWLKPLASTDRATQKRFRSAVRVLRRAPGPIKRVMTKVYWRRQYRAGHGAGIADTLRGAADGRDLLLIETQSALAGQIPAVMQELQGSSNGNRVELRRFESTSMQAFQSTSEQELAVSAVIEWFDASFPKLPSANGSEPQTHRSASPHGSR
jgi:alpha/beta superfamily hydrolase